MRSCCEKTDARKASNDIFQSWFASLLFDQEYFGMLTRML